MNMIVSIAIIDPHYQFRKSLKAFLECDENLNVIHEVATEQDLTDQIEVLELLPDIILLGTDDSLFDSWHALQMIKESYPSTKVIAFSVFHDYYLSRIMVHAGVKGYLSKVTDAHIIREAIYTVNDGKYFIETDAGKFEVFDTSPL